MSVIEDKQLCPCGSGKEYAACCKGKEAESHTPRWGEKKSYRAGWYEADVGVAPETEAPRRAREYFRKGNALQAEGKLEEAIASYQHALLIKPDLAGVHINLGFALEAMGRLEAALGYFRKAAAFDPDNADIYFNIGNILKKQGKLTEAIDSYRRTLALKPNDVESLYNIGNAQQEQGDFDASVNSYTRAIKLNPAYSDAYNNLGNTFQKLGKIDRAIDNYREALRVDAENAEAYSSLINVLLLSCNWKNHDIYVRGVERAVGEGRLILPFLYALLSQSAAAQLKCAQTYTSVRHPAAMKPLWQGQQYNHDRIRVAYLSADLHDHAMAYQLAGLIEKHDRTRFEIYAISFGPDDESSGMRRRLRRAFDRFETVRTLGDYEVARQLRDLEVDIAVDLKGYTKDSRTGILAYRPAPIQVNAMGFPGTMGAEYMDYIIADAQLIPREHQAFYTEQVVYLPDSFQVYDNQRQIDGQAPGRNEAGLPEHGFVFCCFNSSFKITPAMFAIWMRLLDKVPGSVLWLLEDNPFASANLKREAEQRGIAPERLVFASRMPPANQLARYRLADLFLDTLPYNAHTTASDALWAGLPVLACKGETFAGRVSASLLHASGLPDMVVDNLEDYETRATEFATRPELLADVRNRLAQCRDTCALFDTDRYRRSIETAYLTMWERHQRGEAPDTIIVNS